MLTGPVILINFFTKLKTFYVDCLIIIDPKPKNTAFHMMDKDLYNIQFIYI